MSEDRCQRVLQRVDYRTPLILTRKAFVGMLLACFAVDDRLPFEPEETPQDGFQYYRTFYSVPPVIAIITKLHRRDEGAMSFDGGSLGR